MKLNLGCGKKHKEGYLNIDIQEPCDLKHDLRTPLPFPDNFVDEIFAEDCIYTISSRKEWQRLKREMSRVLKGGGKLEIIFLDLECAFRNFLHNKDAGNRDIWLRIIFGGQENEYEFCKNGFTYDKLVSDLSKEGMTNFSTKWLPKDGYDHLPDGSYIHLVCYKQKQP